ncbi:MAG: iron uptake porin [Actinomycetota bacterium]
MRIKTSHPSAKVFAVALAYGLGFTTLLEITVFKKDLAVADEVKKQSDLREKFSVWERQTLQTVATISPRRFGDNSTQSSLDFTHKLLKANKFVSQSFLTNPQPDFHPPFSVTERNPMAQVTSVSQLSDLQPTDWAFQALQSLVERYGCIAGYPNNTYRGNRALTRYEFAAGLNACLDQIHQLIGTGLAHQVSRDDLKTLQRLQAEFAAELATLGQSLNRLEAKTEALESHQFSATTKLKAEVDMAAMSVLGRRRPDRGSLPSNLTFASRTVLSFDSSFSGQDLLRVQLEAGNLTGFSSRNTGTNMLAYNFESGGRNLNLSVLYYRFPLPFARDRGNIWLTTAGLGADDVVNPLQFAGSQSRFGARNPLYRLADGGSGIAANYKLSNHWELALMYLGNMYTQGDPKYGLFDQYTGFTQLGYNSDRFRFAVNYSHYYNPKPGSFFPNVAGRTGSLNAQFPFGQETPTSANAFGLQSAIRLTPNLDLSGWVGYTQAIAEGSPRRSDLDAPRGSRASLFTWGVTVAVKDFLLEKGALGFILGMPPKVIDNQVKSRQDRGTSYHFEAFYRYPLTSNLTITPTIYFILNPEHNNHNSPIGVGLIRANFTF